MAITLLIIGISLALFVYWFRYSAILILQTRSSEEDAAKVAKANLLRFSEVRQELHAPAGADLGGLCSALQRDYRVLKYLLGHAATWRSGYTAEQWLLMADFRFLALWFGATARVRPNSAKLALLEMSQILEYFAGVIGRRLGVAGSASASA